MAILTMANPTTATPTKAIIEYFKPDVLVGAVASNPNPNPSPHPNPNPNPTPTPTPTPHQVGAVGRAPNCFTKEVVQAMVAVQAPYLYPYPWP